MRTTTSFVVPFDIDLVFDCLSNPEWLYQTKGLTIIERSHPGLGSRALAEMDAGPLKIQVEYETIDYYRPVRIAFRHRSQGRRPALARLRLGWPQEGMDDLIALSSIRGGTKVRREWSATWGFLAGLFWPILRWGLSHDGRRLKARLEAELSAP